MNKLEEIEKLLESAEPYNEVIILVKELLAEQKNKAKLEPLRNGYFASVQGEVSQHYNFNFTDRHQIQATRLAAEEIHSEQTLGYLMKHLHTELDDDFAADWDNGEQKKHYIYYNHNFKKWTSVHTYSFERPCDHPFSQPCADKILDYVNKYYSDGWKGEA